MDLPRATTPSRNDLQYDNSNTQVTDRVPEVWGTGSPIQSDYPFQTALTPEPGPRFLYSLPSPPLSPFAPQPPQPVPYSPYRSYQSTHNSFPDGTSPQHAHYHARFDSTAPPAGAYYDLDRMDGKLGASFSRRRTRASVRDTEGLGPQSSSPYANLPQQSSYEGPSTYPYGYFPSGAADAVDSEKLQNSANGSSSDTMKRKGKDRKRRDH
ncbi:hypothetical protein M413DRAFT_14542 [Hebeloma cylindrosporum]|uniref:Uncharacterized protein n=1 Tax=Hebeloma cylindrosporum TaxID=76867 RepID=A0A0C2XBZ0_HEBCY|nr:hypothetical protein M413DRAFT_14542 [Hebeloma cylindrosporum h7]